MWISNDERGAILFPKIWIFVGILCFLCQKIEGQCSKPELSENAVLHESNSQQNSFPEGSIARLTCFPGYEQASGPRTVTCQDGQWDPNPQTFICKKKSCGNPGEVRNGQYNMSEGVDFGATVTAICNVGHFLVGEGKRTCLSDGTWDGREAVCEVVKCGPPPNTIDNGKLESAQQEEYVYNSVVIYACDAGYTLFGNREVRCAQNASWTERPRCKLVECPRPNIPNAQRIEGNSGPYGYRATLVYKCNEGFTMSGASRIVCEENGWSPAVPECKAVECPSPNIPNAQQIEGNSGPYGYRATLVYKCNEGFTMSGASRIVCEENGWSPAVPECKAVPTTSAMPTSRTTVKDTTTPKVSTSFPDKTTQKTSAKETTTEAVPTTSAMPTSRTTVKDTTTPKVSTSFPDKTTQKTSAKETTTEDGRNGAPLVHSSLWMVLATVMAVVAQNGLFSLTL